MFSNNYLFHISEQSDIEIFEPKVGKDGSAKVWAINTARIANYLVPRQCPRACYWANSKTSNSDKKLLGTDAVKVVVEEHWREKIEAAELSIYVFAKTGFELEDTNAGYFTSKDTQIPIDKLTIHEPFATLKQLDASIQFCADLTEMRRKILKSSLSYSMIRITNASPNQSTQT